MTISNEGNLSMARKLSPLQTSTPPMGPSSMPEKLHGRAFYESIGSPKFVLAPMVDQSEFAWRMLTRSFMLPSSPQDLVAYTPMLHARLFRQTPKFRDNHFQPLRDSLIAPTSTAAQSLEKVYLDGNPALDRPLFVQFCANEPDELLAAAEYVAPFCDAVDLNLGCPQGIARKGKYGAFLQEDQDLVFSLVNKLHRELQVPVTAKIRILETKEKTLEYARNVLKAGASILTVHGRTREMKGHKTGLADWSTIRYLRDSLPKETVLFSNGNILKREDVDRCLEETGADGVMSAEGNLHDPSIFAEAPAVGEEGREYWRGRDGEGGWRMDAVFRRYIDIIYKYVLEVPTPERKPLYLPSDPEVDESIEEGEEGPPRKRQRRDEEFKKGADNEESKKRGEKKGEKASSPNLLAMQPHCFRLLRPLVARHHDVRNALAKARAGNLIAFEHVLQLVEKVVKQGIREYELTNGQSWEDECTQEEEMKKAKEEERAKELTKVQIKLGEFKAIEGKAEMDESSVETVRACKRPWWIVQPYVRPLPKEALAKGALSLSKKDMAKMEAASAALKTSQTVASGHTVLETVGNGASGEKVEVPANGMVSG